MLERCDRTVASLRERCSAISRAVTPVSAWSSTACSAGVSAESLAIVISVRSVSMPQGWAPTTTGASVKQRNFDLKTDEFVLCRADCHDPNVIPEPLPMLSRPLDTLGRPLHDLRISVTDRCNFRCVYCMPRAVFGPEHAFLDREELLTFDEITRLAGIF